MSPRPLSPRRRAVFMALTLTVGAAGAGLVWIAYQSLRPLAGEELNRAAWAATFRERGLAVPPGGPRDGFWGARMPGWTKDDELGWFEPEAHLAGLVEEDAQGLQRYAGSGRHLLIVGGSVAWGAYASDIEATYFAQLARRLGAAGWPLRLTILAAGAWTSDNEVKAFRSRGLATGPEVVLFLDGVNDFTQGEGTEDERVARYLDRMCEARDLARARGITIVFALQPSLLQKPDKSRLERRIVELSGHAAQDDLLRHGYPRLRDGLAALARDGNSSFVDCSGAFDGERATTITDIWHFSDPGHRLLAEALARGLLPVLAAHR